MTSNALLIPISLVGIEPCFCFNLIQLFRQQNVGIKSIRSLSEIQEAAPTTFPQFWRPLPLLSS